jgi:hypothetical protein
MNENDRKLLDKNAVIFSTDMNLTMVIPILMQSGVLSGVHLEQLNVSKMCNFVNSKY